MKNPKFGFNALQAFVSFINNSGNNVRFGVDGTVGSARELVANATSLFYATAANTIADANWKKVDWTSL